MPEQGPPTCPQCKKPFRPGARTCVWCGLELPKVKKRSQTEPAEPTAMKTATGSGHCPGCGRVFQVGAENCMWCGHSLESVEMHDPEMTCPICNQPLEKMVHEKWILFVCGECRGAFVTQAVLKRFEKMYESLPMSDEARQAATTGATNKKEIVDVDPDRFYRKCPQCGEHMARRRYHRVSQIVVDECIGHGVWFDPEEFEQAVAFLKQGGIEAGKKWANSHAIGGTGEVVQEARAFGEMIAGWGRGGRGFGGGFFF